MSTPITGQLLLGLPSWPSEGKKSALVQFGGDVDDDEKMAKLLFKQAFLEKDFVLEI